MIYTTLTKKALRLSFEAHKDQVDKDNIPYVFHPYEVAEAMDDETSVCVALLHDIIEDTDYTARNLRDMGFPEEIVTAVEVLTHSKAVPYMDYVARVKENPLAKKVKLADLKHNMTRERMEHPTKQDIARWEKYEKAYEFLTQTGE